MELTDALKSLIDKGLIEVVVKGNAVTYRLTKEAIKLAKGKK